MQQAGEMDIAEEASMSLLVGELPVSPGKAPSHVFVCFVLHQGPRLAKVNQLT